MATSWLSIETFSKADASLIAARDQRLADTGPAAPCKNVTARL
jgi:hypothetical protein